MNILILRKLDGIAQKVEQDLFEAVRILEYKFVLDIDKSIDSHSIS